MKFINEVLLVIFLSFLVECHKFKNKKISLIRSLFEDYKSLRIKDASLSRKNIRKLFAFYEPKANQIVLMNRPPKGKTNYLAKGVYDPSNFRTGWNKLFLKTKNTANSILQCWAAGFLEGFLTSKSIYNHLSNIKRVFLGKHEQYEQLKDIYRTVDKYLSEKLKVEYFLSLEKEEQQKWIYYSCIRAQLEGLEKGYNANGDVKIEKEDFYILNSVGNIDELKMYLDAKDFKFDEEETKFYYKPNLNKFFRDTDVSSIWKNFVMKNSAIIKLVEEKNKINLLIGHNSVKDYSFLLKILKIYNFDFNEKITSFPMRRNKITFTSYPGALYSGDEFYITNYKLCIFQSKLTPINFLIYKQALDEKDYIPDFMRIMAANYHARNAKEWFNTFKTEGSRVYASQWLIADYKELHITRKKPTKRLVTLIEEIPGIIQKVDITKLVYETGFFTSFNIPFTENIQDLLGISYYFDNGLNLFSERFNPRLTIFNKFQSNVTKLEDLNYLMSYNGFGMEVENFDTDPSKSDSSAGISTRLDLLKTPVFSGGIDVKLIDEKLMSEGSILVRAGPTFSYNENMKPFNFSMFITDDSIYQYKHGVPNVFDFDQIIFKDNLKHN